MPLSWYRSNIGLATTSNVITFGRQRLPHSVVSKLDGSSLRPFFWWLDPFDVPFGLLLDLRVLLDPLHSHDVCLHIWRHSDQPVKILNRTFFLNFLVLFRALDWIFEEMFVLNRTFKRFKRSAMTCCYNNCNIHCYLCHAESVGDDKANLTRVHRAGVKNGK